MYAPTRRLGPVALLLIAACGGGGGGGGTIVVAPQNLVYPDALAIFMVDVAIAPNTPTWTGDPVQFSIDPALPAGLAIDPATGRISGTPTAVAPRTTHAVTASNVSGSAEFELVLSAVEPPRFAYTLSADDSTITLFTVDATTGKLHTKGYLLCPPTEIGPERMIVHPSGRFAYVPNLGTSNVSAYSIDTTNGWLAARGFVGVGTGPHDMAIHPSGFFAWITSRSSDEMQLVGIDTQTGALTPIGAPLATGPGPSALAIDPQGGFLFLTLHGHPTTGAGSAVQAYSIDAATGALTPSGPALSLNGTQPVGISVDPVTTTLCVILEGLDLVIPIHYDAATGALTALLPNATGVAPAAVSIDPTGQFAYVANAADASVSCFAIDAATGELSLVDTVGAGSTPLAVTIHPTGEFVYVLNQASHDVQVYRADEANGALTFVENVVTRQQPSGIALVQGAHPVSWVPRFVHVASSGSDEISTYTVNPATGALTEVGLAPLTGHRPVSIAVDARRRFVYVANRDSQTIGVYGLDQVTGALSEITFPGPVAGKPVHLTVDPSGRFLYVAAQDVVAPGDGWVTTYAIDEGDGSLAPLDTHETGSRASFVACSTTGQYLYVGNTGDGPGTGTISVLRISPVDGTLSFSAAAAASPGVAALGVHPRGRVLYAVLRDADVSVQYAMDPDTGGLTLMPGTADGGLQPRAIAIPRTGGAAYVAAYNPIGNGNVAMFAVDASLHLVEPAEITVDGLHPVDLAIDASGRFLYVANSGSNDVSLMRIDPVTGGLVVLGAVASGLEPAAIVVTSVTQ